MCKIKRKFGEREKKKNVIERKQIDSGVTETADKEQRTISSLSKNSFIAVSVSFFPRWLLRSLFLYFYTDPCLDAPPLASTDQHD